MNENSPPKTSNPLSEESISLGHEKNTSTSLSSFNMYESLLQDFYGFDHSNTKWILSTLSSSLSLKRLKLSGDKHICLLQSYFEIPDNPDQYPILKNEDLKLNAPAFHSLASLYLNPLGISIYTRNEAALKLLIELKLNNFSDPCFVQKWWNKGDDTFYTDFSAVHIVTLALRRNFFECIPLMMLAGFNPKDRIYQIDHIQSSDKSKTRVYQDCLDQALTLMSERPCFDVASLLKIITDKKLTNRYDPIVFEMQTIDEDKDGVKMRSSRIRSLFRLVIYQANLSCNGKFSSVYLGILEIIQKQGFFTYLSKELSGVKPSNFSLDSKHKLFCEENFIQHNESEIERLYQSDLAKLSSDKRKQYLLLDRNICIGMLFLWCIDVNSKGRRNIGYRLTKIIVNILLDCNLMVWFLQSSSEIVVRALTLQCCGVDTINVVDVSTIRFSILDFLRYRENLKKRVFRGNEKLQHRLFSNVNASHSVRPKTKNRLPRKESTPYLVINSRAMHSWNMSKKSNTLSLDFPMMSLQHKMGKLIYSTIHKSSKKASTVYQLDESDDTINRASPILSASNSPDSIEEQSSLNTVTQTICNPPPLIVRKAISTECESQRTAIKRISAADLVDDISSMNYRRRGGFIAVDEVFQHESLFANNILV